MLQDLNVTFKIYTGSSKKGKEEKKKKTWFTMFYADR